MSDLFPYDKSPIPTVPDLSDQIECTTELIGRGGYGTVYKGRWLGAATNTTPATIAIKVIDLAPLTDDAKRKRRFKQITRELSLWCRIQHENILPLLGIARINGDTNIPAFVCPWMENGNAKEFRSRNPRFPPILIIYDIINGLHYLHTFKPEIVHGDIKAVNVLINNRCEACLCDFGLSRFLIDNTLWKTTATAAGGTARWMAPELLNGDVSTPTKESDIYAYAMTCYEILSGDAPFQSILNEMAVLFKITKGQRPDRMESFHSDFMWDIITQCWEQEPKDRPVTGKVLGLLRPKVDWKGVEEGQARIGEKDVALAKVEKEAAVLKEQLAEALAKAKEDLKAVKEEKEKALAKAEDVLKQKDVAWASEMAVLKEKAKEDMKALREEKEKALTKAEEVLQEKGVAWAKMEKEMAVLKEQMAETLAKAEEDMKEAKEEKEEALKAFAKAEEVLKGAQSLSNMSVDSVPAANQEHGLLRVVVENATLIYESRAYVVLRVGDKEVKTKRSAIKTAYPEWNESFSLPAGPRTPRLLVWVHEYKTLGKDKDLGGVDVDLWSNLKLQGHSTKKLTLPIRDGSLNLLLEFDSEIHVSSINDGPVPIQVIRRTTSFTSFTSPSRFSIRGERPDAEYDSIQ